MISQWSQILQTTQEEISTGQVKEPVLEVLAVMIAYLGLEDLTTIYNVIVPWLSEPANSYKQKRAYQVGNQSLYGILI